MESVKFENHIIICGWMSNAESIIESLIQLSGSTVQLVLVNDLPEEQVTNILDKFSKAQLKFVRGDYTRHTPLERANIKSARAVLLLPNLAFLDAKAADEKTLLATLNIKSTFTKLKVVAFIMLQENQTHVKRARADEIFISDQYSEFVMASDILSPGMKQLVGELFKTEKTKNALDITDIPPRFIGRPYKELFGFFREQKRVLLVGVLALHESVNISDFLSSDSSHLDAFIERKLKESGRTLGDESKIFVNLNPEDDYIIRENEKAVVIL